MRTDKFTEEAAFYLETPIKQTRAPTTTSLFPASTGSVSLVKEPTTVRAASGHPEGPSSLSYLWTPLPMHAAPTAPPAPAGHRAMGTARVDMLDLEADSQGSGKKRKTQQRRLADNVGEAGGYPAKRATRSQGVFSLRTRHGPPVGAESPLSGCSPGDQTGALQCAHT